MAREPSSKSAAITLDDIHQAIERLALEQTGIALALMRIVAQAEPLSQQDRDEIFKSMDEASDNLLELADRFVDAPRGR